MQAIVETAIDVTDLLTQFFGSTVVVNRQIIVQTLKSLSEAEGKPEEKQLKEHQEEEEEEEEKLEHSLGAIRVEGAPTAALHIVLMLAHILSLEPAKTSTTDGHRQLAGLWKQYSLEYGRWLLGDLSDVGGAAWQDYSGPWTLYFFLKKYGAGFVSAAKITTEKNWAVTVTPKYHQLVAEGRWVPPARGSLHPSPFATAPGSLTIEELRQRVAEIVTPNGCSPAKLFSRYWKKHGSSR
eukprot:TRINITY_DN4265_c1_g1_i11.p1 TRINITY_DN4265_c1_g1~~TRINITY_DN4265_c1_g1_i11.p1  ORF type:complete len:238 (-),score=50.76 TRINITY_DN4265_c1_g1_i11:563-1276(-)